MSANPRWEIRPRQRGRGGVPGLTVTNRPAANEMAFDQVEVVVPGRLISSSNEHVSEVFAAYRRSLQSRSTTSAEQWSLPGQAADSFSSHIRGFGTLGAARLNATYGPDGHKVSLSLRLNPTRTLLHLLSRLDPNLDTISQLRALPASEFFSAAERPHAANSLDDNDNAVGDYSQLRSALGADWAGAFIHEFERKLRTWAIEVVAPASAEYRHNTTGPHLIAQGSGHRVALHWSNLSLRLAEVYFERRHADAPALMNRLSNAVLAAHSDVGWQAYPISEFGGREQKSLTVGIKPTRRIRQVIYAKTADRIRIETKYHSKVRDNLRGAPISASEPLADILVALRDDVRRRMQWEAFCAMCAEPAAPMLSDFATVAGIIARCATKARVDPEPIFAELLGTEGFDESPPNGRFPARLARHLASEGLIDQASLIRRTRPGRPRRHYLADPYRSVATLIQKAFLPQTS